MVKHPARSGCHLHLPALYQCRPGRNDSLGEALKATPWGWVFVNIKPIDATLWIAAIIIASALANKVYGEQVMISFKPNPAAQGTTCLATLDNIAWVECPGASNGETQGNVIVVDTLTDRGITCWKFASIGGDDPIWTEPLCYRTGGYGCHAN